VPGCGPCKTAAALRSMRHSPRADGNRNGASASHEGAVPGAGASQMPPRDPYARRPPRECAMHGERMKESQGSNPCREEAVRTRRCVPAIIALLLQMQHSTTSAVAEDRDSELAVAVKACGLCALRTPRLRGESFDRFGEDPACKGLSRDGLPGLDEFHGQLHQPVHALFPLRGRCGARIA
jgi:hypothetical protein